MTGAGMRGYTGCRSIVQPLLRVSQPDDPDEVEGEAVAHLVASGLPTSG